MKLRSVTPRLTEFKAFFTIFSTSQYIIILRGTVFLAGSEAESDVASTSVAAVLRAGVHHANRLRLLLLPVQPHAGRQRHCRPRRWPDLNRCVHCGLRRERPRQALRRAVRQIQRDVLT